MPEEFKTTGEPLRGKQATKVTYHGSQTDPEVDVVYGVAMKKGESVDFAEHMSPEQAQRFAARLASNPSFQVEGMERAKPVPAGVLRDPTEVRSAAAQVAGARLLAERQGQEPPEGYDAPLTNILESQNTAKQQASKPAQEQPASQRSTPPRGR